MYSVLFRLEDEIRLEIMDKQALEKWLDELSPYNLEFLNKPRANTIPLENWPEYSAFIMKVEFPRVTKETRTITTVTL